MDETHHINALPFAQMAARIERIDEKEFAGAVVVVPPTGEPIAFLVSDPDPNLAQFWSSVASRVEVAAAEARENEVRQAQGFAIRR